MSWEDNVKRVVPYVPGEQPKSKVIKLNTNENPYPPSPKVREVLSNYDIDELRLYPDVNAGELGMALAKYDNFTSYGLNIIALFDNDKSKIGGEINGKKILDISNLPELANVDGVEIAILTVPGKFAQKTSQFIVKSNIKYIWNFTPTVLDVPDDVQVWNENLMGSFLQFTYDI